MGDIGTFSFFPSKNLGGFGDGGLCTTGDEALAQRMIRFRNHGMKPKYFHHDVGLNARLDALQAAILLVKIEHLDAWSAGRQANAAWYDAAFAAAGAPTSAVSLDEGGLPLRTPEPAVPGSHRDAIRETLKAAAIGNEVYYPRCLHEQDCYRDLGHQAGDFPHAERASRETIAIPIFPELSEPQRQHVVDTLLDAVRSI